MPPGPSGHGGGLFRLFGISSPAQTQVIQDRAQVIQTSDTDNGVTVSMESVMGDAHNAQILFSIRRTDGQPLLPQRPDLSWLINQDHALLFEEDSTLNMFTPAEDDQPDRYLLSSALHFVPFGGHRFRFVLPIFRLQPKLSPALLEGCP